MKDNEQREEVVVLNKPPSLGQTSVESYYLNTLIAAESTILEYLWLPYVRRAEPIAKKPA